MHRRDDGQAFQHERRAFQIGCSRRREPEPGRRVGGDVVPSSCPAPSACRDESSRKPGAKSMGPRAGLEARRGIARLPPWLARSTARLLRAAVQQPPKWPFRSCVQPAFRDASLVAACTRRVAFFTPRLHLPMLREIASEARIDLAHEARRHPASRQRRADHIRRARRRDGRRDGERGSATRARVARRAHEPHHPLAPARDGRRIAAGSALVDSRATPPLCSSAAARDSTRALSRRSSAKTESAASEEASDARGSSAVSSKPVWRLRRSQPPCESGRTEIGRAHV